MADSIASNLGERLKQFWGEVGDPLLAIIARIGEIGGNAISSIAGGAGVGLMNSVDAMLGRGGTETASAPISAPETTAPVVAPVVQNTQRDIGDFLQDMGAGASRIVADIQKLSDFSPKHLGETGAVLANEPPRMQANLGYAQGVRDQGMSIIS